MKMYACVRRHITRLKKRKGNVYKEGKINKFFMEKHA